MAYRQRYWIAAFLAPTILLFVGLYIYPLVTVVVSSFTEWRLASNMKFIGLDNYRSLFADSDFRAGLANTLIWLVIHWVIYVGMGLAVALLTVRRTRASKLVRTFYLIPNMLPIAAVSFLFYFIFNPSIGPFNALLEWIGLEHWALNWYQDARTAFLTVTVTSVFYAGVLTLLISAELASVPAEIYEAARIDGADAKATTLYVTLPLLRNILGTAMILATVHVLKSFEIIYLTTLGGPGNKTVNLPVLIYRSAMNNNHFSYSNTIAMVTLIIGAVSIILINRIFQMGKSHY